MERIDLSHLTREKLGPKSKFQLFVRWFREHDDAGGLVELTKNDKKILSEPVHNNDRVYGFCKAIVRILQLLGHDIEMPKCLQGRACYNRNRED